MWNIYLLIQNSNIYWLSSLIKEAPFWSCLPELVNKLGGHFRRQTIILKSLFLLTLFASIICVNDCFEKPEVSSKHDSISVLNSNILHTFPKMPFVKTNSVEEVLWEKPAFRKWRLEPFFDKVWGSGVAIFLRKQKPIMIRASYLKIIKGCLSEEQIQAWPLFLH